MVNWSLWNLDLHCATGVYRYLIDFQWKQNTGSWSFCLTFKPLTTARWEHFNITPQAATASLNITFSEWYVLRESSGGVTACRSNYLGFLLISPMKPKCSENVPLEEKRLMNTGVTLGHQDGVLRQSCQRSKVDWKTLNECEVKAQIYLIKEKNRKYLLPYACKENIKSGTEKSAKAVKHQQTFT